MAKNKGNTLTTPEQSLVESFREKLDSVDSRSDLVAFVEYCERALRQVGYIQPPPKDDKEEM